MVAWTEFVIGIIIGIGLCIAFPNLPGALRSIRKQPANTIGEVAHVAGNT